MVIVMIPNTIVIVIARTLYIINNDIEISIVIQLKTGSKHHDTARELLLHGDFEAAAAAVAEAAARADQQVVPPRCLHRPVHGRSGRCYGERSMPQSDVACSRPNNINGIQ